MAARSDHALRVFIVAGEHSGDALGGKLMAALRRIVPRPVRFAGVGGEAMQAEGFASLFPLSDVAVMGPVAILKALPRLYRRVTDAARAGIAFRPHVVVIVDSPEFTHPIARRIRKAMPDVAIIDYVSPSVWAWRPGRAARMRAYVDHVMAILPFEPEVHARLGGPACTYVGHPLIEQLPLLAGADPKPLIDSLAIGEGGPILVVLPGSRRSEVERLMGPFGQAVDDVRARLGALSVIIPTVESVRPLVEAEGRRWSVKPLIVSGEAAKHQAFRAARAALAASGTVTLELALAGTPMVVAYRVDGIAAHLQFLVKTPHFALSNLVLARRAFPELMQDDCTPSKLADTLVAVIEDGPVRVAQLAALGEVPGRMVLEAGAPSEAAARIVAEYAVRRPG
jgi:lipid-A-disaccharide synthase